MKKNKILQLLRSFSANELRSFREFIASPFFNKKDDVVKFLDLLSEPIKDPGQLPTKKDLYRALYPDSPYDDKQFRYLASTLTGLAERFLAIKKYEEDPVRRELDLLSCFVERDLRKSYSLSRRRLEAMIGAKQHKDDLYFLRQIQLAEIEDKYFGKQLTRRFDPTPQRAADSLDRYYFLKKLEYSCGMLDRQAVVKGTYELNFPDVLIDYLVEREFFSQDLIALFYTVFMTLKEENNEAHFFTFRDTLLHPSGNLPADDLKQFYYICINYCARKIRQGREDYIDEAINLYVEGLDRGILYENHQLSPWTFTNVVKLALRQKRYKWIEDFIRQYAEKLPETFRQDALNYNLAELFYYTRDFDKALIHLNQVKLSDLNFHLGARVILAKIYFETGEEETLLSLIAAFTIFLKRNKRISNQLKNTYLNFCDILFQIVKNNPRKMAALREKIENTSLLTDRGWLLKIYKGAVVV